MGGAGQHCIGRGANHVERRRAVSVESCRQVLVARLHKGTIKRVAEGGLPFAPSTAQDTGVFCSREVCHYPRVGRKRMLHDDFNYF